MTVESLPSYTPPDHEPGRRTLAVRHALATWERDCWPSDQPERNVVIGCSGGGDSLALVAAACHRGWTVHAVVVDHGLQENSTLVAQRAAEVCEALGAQPHIIAVAVAHAGEGLESAARMARYEALGAAAHELGNLPVLVAHTAADQAETVLMGLARGSGLPAVAGMAPISHRHPATHAGARWLGRPLLGVTREDTAGSCAELGLTPWQDPHNSSPAFLRSRIRHQVLPLLREYAGDGIVDNLARTAVLTRVDEEYLQAEARRRYAESRVSTGEDGSADRLSVEKMRNTPDALRPRVYKIWLEPWAGPLTYPQLAAIDALITNWRGQGGVAVAWPQGRGRAEREQQARGGWEHRARAEREHQTGVDRDLQARGGFGPHANEALGPQAHAGCGSHANEDLGLQPHNPPDGRVERAFPAHAGDYPLKMGITRVASKSIEPLNILEETHKRAEPPGRSSPQRLTVVRKDGYLTIQPS